MMVNGIIIRRFYFVILDQVSLDLMVGTLLVNTTRRQEKGFDFGDSLYLIDFAISMFLNGFLWISSQKSIFWGLMMMSSCHLPAGLFVLQRA